MPTNTMSLSNRHIPLTGGKKPIAWLRKVVVDSFCNLCENTGYP
jgi:hypothetical protein